MPALPEALPVIPMNGLGELSRLCPDCQVATLENACWICGRDINYHELKARVSIPNPGGPNKGALDQTLAL